MHWTTCIGCGARFPASDGPTHRYMESSSGCWACYGDVLAREYSDLQYHRVHRLTVDTYALQHPGQPALQTLRSVVLHGISLCAILEEGVSLGQATRVIEKAAQHKERFVWLSPPASMGTRTIADVHEARTPDEHADLVWHWAASAWSAWSEHHAMFRAWLAESWV